jgi:hypothetical protein
MNVLVKILMIFFIQNGIFSRVLQAEETHLDLLSKNSTSEGVELAQLEGRSNLLSETLNTRLQFLRKEIPDLQRSNLLMEIEKKELFWKNVDLHGRMKILEAELKGAYRDSLSEHVQYLEKHLLDLNKENVALQMEKEKIYQRNVDLQERVRMLEIGLKNK